ncbi:hypothetical protein ACI1S7_11070, partial [Lactococcus petauri]
ETETINTSITLYQEVYGGDKAAGISRKLKVAGGFAAGLGLSVMGGGLAADASANTVTPSLEKKLTKDILATQESTAIELTDSTSTTEEGSSSDRPSESQSDSESATETQSEAESQADVGTMAVTSGWTGKILRIYFNAGDLPVSNSGADFSKASGQISLQYQDDGNIRMWFYATGITKRAPGYDNIAIKIKEGPTLQISFTQDVTPPTATTLNKTALVTGDNLQRMYSLARTGQDKAWQAWSQNSNLAYGWVLGDFNVSAGLAPILAFSTSMSTSTSDSQSTSTSTSQSVITSRSASQSLSTSQSVSVSDSVSNSVSLSNSDSLSGSVSISQSVSDSQLESRAASISASLSGSTSASAFLSHLASQSQSASHLESFLESIIVSESLSTSTSESNSLY